MDRTFLVLLAVVVSLVLGSSLRRRLRKPSVTSREHYRNLAIVPFELDGTGVYCIPDNYERVGGRLRAVSDRLVRRERQINSLFRDKIPWCMPPSYGDLEMRGPFPSASACGLESVCASLRRNVRVFASEFNANKDAFKDNPDGIGYGGSYGRVEADGSTDRFPETNRILRSEPRYNVTQVFNARAGYVMMGTAFTVLFPGASIHPHFGPTNYKFRIHLCIDIDGEGGIVTPYGTRTWRVGETFVLDDSYLHAGFYEGARPRVVLIVDIAKRGLTLQDIDEAHRHDAEDELIVQARRDRTKDRTVGPSS